ncbi:hypothetical protein ROZALSC1DRAFT_28289 [Rozella allomycis CSF55]|uniref:Uncharacterized protein n=1 Tax=Rozella allomycis (strain CSF55) TaxID=988480 RepID=A0A075B2R6_ROZAC|nr:hypothetical protein O9G_005965 [Rozella allomycis CSF55]RKP20206.1 hypothetical protein ROZALSC1DRAFT_28289 [Rozella allomycis CSF55]|eukprot:EPZ36862.1 hypothetical protein O9G_005965 [Rozella allomycis CSF55]
MKNWTYQGGVEVCANISTLLTESVVADSRGSNYKDPCGNVDYMLRSGSKYCSKYDPKEYVSRYCTIYQPTMTGMTKCIYECMRRSSIVYIEIKGLDRPKRPQTWFIFLPVMEL